jgi:hypothetical protein
MPAAIRAGLPGLMQQLHPASGVMQNNTIESGCLPVAVSWPHPHPATRKPSEPGDRANLYLVPFETFLRETNDIGGWKETPRSLAIALVAVQDSGASGSSDAAFSVVARTLQPLRHETTLDAFDFADYRLNEYETAFGLRSFLYTTYIGGGGMDEFLELFRVKDGVIRPILRTLIGSSNVVKGEERGDPKGAVIQVLATKTKGMFDLKKSVRGGRSAIFRWNGRVYETHDPEPVECVNERCDDIEDLAGEAESLPAQSSNDPCEGVLWDLAIQGRIDTSFDRCPNSAGANVLAQAADGARVLGAIPEGRKINVYLGHSPANFYRVEGGGMPGQGWMSGFVHRKCVRLETDRR